MPEQSNVAANQMQNNPEHIADSAAASKDHQTLLKPHEETILAENMARREQSEHADKLHHGAAVEHNKK